MFFENFFFLIFMNFFNKQKSFILILLSLEVFVLFMTLFLFFSSFNKIIILFFLFVGVLEAIMGLSILIFLIRTNSKEKILFL